MRMTIDHSRAWAIALALGLTLFPSSGHAARRRARPATAVPAPSPARLPVNLVGRWSGDGSAQDTVGGHNGSLVGVKFAPGRFGQAFSFDGHAYVSIPFSLDFDFTPADRFTVSAWVKPAAVGTYQAIFVKDVPGGPWEWGIIIDPQNHFYTGKNANDVAQSKTTIKPGTWYHVAVTYDNGAVEMYVNGKLENQAKGVSIGQSLGGIALGHKGDKALPKEDPDWYKGLIDEVRLYNRALTASEIQALYRNGAAL